MGLSDQSQSQTRAVWMDRLGITASVGCALHCILTGLLFLALPGAFKISHDVLTQDWIHWGLALLVVPVAIFSIGKGFKLHKKRSTLFFGALGIVFLTAGLAAHPHPSEFALTFLGGIFLALAHFINLKSSIFKSR